MSEVPADHPAPIRPASRAGRSLRLLATAGLVAGAWLASSAPCAAQLDDQDPQLWSESTLGSTVNADDWMGRALAAGDFDGDGYDDLAVGLPGRTAYGVNDYGSVAVVNGEPAGLDQNSVVFLGQPTDHRVGDFFGWTLAVGDFDHDGYDDLAVGVPYEDVDTTAGSQADAGEVDIFYGGPAGLTDDRFQGWIQGSDGVPGTPEAGDHFGQTLVAADFDLDGYTDLAIGIPHEDLDVPATSDVGAVEVLLGSPTGLTAAGNRFYQPGLGVLSFPAQAGEHFGAALTAGHVVDNGTDLFVGDPQRDVSGQSGAGEVFRIEHVLGGAFLHSYRQGANGVPGANEAGDQFGAALAAGDFDGDGYDEIAIGIPGEDVESTGATNAGALVTLNLDGVGESRLWIQSDLPPQASEQNDHFASRLATGDFNGDGVADLAVGVPNEALAAGNDVGVVQTLLGEAGQGPTATGTQALYKAIDPLQAGDETGYALAAGRFRGYASTSLVLGSPFAASSGISQAGAVSVYFSTAIFLDGFETGDDSRWSTAAP